MNKSEFGRKYIQNWIWNKVCLELDLEESMFKTGIRKKPTLKDAKITPCGHTKPREIMLKHVTSR